MVQAVGLPDAIGVMNFMMLVATLSTMDNQLCVTTRMMFSLLRTGHVPRSLGELSSQGMSLSVLLLSDVSIAPAALLSLVCPGQSFALMMAVPMSGAFPTWLMTFFTYLYFRYYRARHNGAPLVFRMCPASWSTLLGPALMAMALVTILFIKAFRVAPVFGVPLLALLNILYLIFVHRPGRNCPIKQVTP